MTMLEPLGSLLDQARQWIQIDPDIGNRTQLQVLIDTAAEGNDAHRVLADAFGGPLTFGTAGLRAPMGPGTARMNLVTVARAAAGLASFLSGIAPGPHRSSHLVVIGFDGRRHSDDFARESCAVLAGAGLEVAVLPHPTPTPVLAFAVRHLGASAGVMVTASHNPARDNGCKVYLGPGIGDVEGRIYAGSQITTPQDAQIAACIEQVGGAFDELPRGEQWLTLDDSIIGDYVRRAAANVGNGPRELRVAHTAMHGVGGREFSAAASLAGFTDIRHVPEQAQPDPDFPTVVFPNPEEPGALDRVFALAAKVAADIVIAHDPDADRCAVGVRDNGGWRRLSGDEVGALLAWWLVTRRDLPTHAHLQWPADATVATTLVSSPWLREFAASRGLRFAQTLTGFKWLAQVPNLAYAYEEALGYSVDSDAVRDKDGITAALLVMEVAAHAKARGLTLNDTLERIWAEHGRWFTESISIRIDSRQAIEPLMRRIATEPPSQVADLPLVTAEDLRAGVDGLPPTAGVRWMLAGGSRVVIRPSGTEPKVKAYIASRDGDMVTRIAAEIAEVLSAGG